MIKVETIGELNAEAFAEQFVSAVGTSEREA